MTHGDELIGIGTDVRGDQTEDRHSLVVRPDQPPRGEDIAQKYDEIGVLSGGEEPVPPKGEFGEVLARRGESGTLGCGQVPNLWIGNQENVSRPCSTLR